MQNLYDQLTALLDKHHAQYRLIDHKEEGRTEIVSSYRGNKLEQAAKCMVLVVHLGKKEKKYVLGVIPGDKQIDFDAVRKLFGASYVSFAPSDVAEELSGSVVGTVLPFSFRPDLELIVDPKHLSLQKAACNPHPFNDPIRRAYLLISEPNPHVGVEQCLPQAAD